MTLVDDLKAARATSFYDELPCEISGECEPDDTGADICNCVFCGSEMYRHPKLGWINWDHPAFEASSATTDRAIANAEQKP